MWDADVCQGFTGFFGGGGADSCIITPRGVGMSRYLIFPFGWTDSWFTVPRLMGVHGAKARGDERGRGRYAWAERSMLDAYAAEMVLLLC